MTPQKKNRGNISGTFYVFKTSIVSSSQILALCYFMLLKHSVPLSEIYRQMSVLALRNKKVGDKLPDLKHKCKQTLYL